MEGPKDFINNLIYEYFKRHEDFKEIAKLFKQKIKVEKQFKPLKTLEELVSTPDSDTGSSKDEKPEKIEDVAEIVVEQPKQNRRKRKQEDGDDEVVKKPIKKAKVENRVENGKKKEENNTKINSKKDSKTLSNGSVEMEICEDESIETVTNETNKKSKKGPKPAAAAAVVENCSSDATRTSKRNKKEAVLPDIQPSNENKVQTVMMTRNKKSAAKDAEEAATMETKEKPKKKGRNKAKTEVEPEKPVVEKDESSSSSSPDEEEKKEEPSGNEKPIGKQGKNSKKISPEMEEDKTASEIPKATVAVPKTKPTNQRGKKRANSPFRRVDSNKVIVDAAFERLASANHMGTWGERASESLKHCKGKSFRHEKTKKKRGSYRGGKIDTSVRSIKFDD